MSNILFPFTEFIEFSVVYKTIFIYDIILYHLQLHCQSLQLHDDIAEVSFQSLVLL